MAEAGRRAAPGSADASANRLSVDQIWRQITKASFAVVSHVTPAGESRSSGVLYAAQGRRLYVVVAPNSWKARHIAAHGQVAVTVPVRRGGLLGLMIPIPPATISFHATATVHPADSVEIPQALAKMMPPTRLNENRIIELTPKGHFVTYGLGVSLTRMRDPEAAGARVAVS